jgi:hypothetical protein
MIEQRAEWLQDGVDGRWFWAEGIRSVRFGWQNAAYQPLSLLRSDRSLCDSRVTRELAILERMLPGLTGEAGGRSVE